MFIARTAVAGASVPKLARLSIDYGLTEHCNINCHACAHASPVLPEKSADLALLGPRDLRSTVRRLRGMVRDWT